MSTCKTKCSNEIPSDIFIELWEEMGCSHNSQIHSIDFIQVFSDFQIHYPKVYIEEPNFDDLKMSDLVW